MCVCGAAAANGPRRWRGRSAARRSRATLARRILRRDRECHACGHASGSREFAARARELNCRLVFDTIYRPRETKLLQLAARRGIETVSGVEMFVAQGTAQWEIWTGERAPVEAMRRAVIRALKPEKSRAARGKKCKPKRRIRTMIQPDFKTFSRLAKQGNLVPVYETYTADLLTPVGAYLRIAREREIFLSARKRGGRRKHRALHLRRRESRGSVSRARARLHARNRRQAVHFDDNPVEQLRRLTERYRPVRVPGLPPLIAGAIGYFAYDMVRLVESIPDTRPRRCGPGRLRDDVLPRPRRLRPRAASRLDHSQCFHRRAGQPAREIRRGGARNPRARGGCSSSRCLRSRQRAARQAAARRVEHDEAAIHRGGAQGQVVHSRRRRVSDRREPAISRRARPPIRSRFTARCAW